MRELRFGALRRALPCVQKAAALKAEIQQKEASKATQVPPKIILPVELIRRTRMCDDWLQYGRCSSGTDCAFAHDVQEMHHNRWVVGVL